MTALLEATDQTDDNFADRYFAALHALCTYYPLRRARECDWAPSGYCNNCGRPMPTDRPNQPGSIK